MSSSLQIQAVTQFDPSLVTKLQYLPKHLLDEIIVIYFQYRHRGGGEGQNRPPTHSEFISLLVEFGLIDYVHFLLRSPDYHDYYQEMIEAAARNGQRDVIDYFLDLGFQPFLGSLMDPAMEGGHLELVEWIEREVYAQDKSIREYNTLAKSVGKSGDISLVTWLEQRMKHHKQNITQRFYENIVYGAAERNHQDLIEEIRSRNLMHPLDLYGNVMLDAAKGGNLDLLKWVHQQYMNERPTSNTPVIPTYGTIMINAAFSGRGDIIDWIREQSGQGGGIAIANYELMLDLAVKGGHIKLVKEFMEELEDDFTAFTEFLEESVLSGNLEMITFWRD